MVFIIFFLLFFRHLSYNYIYILDAFYNVCNLKSGEDEELLDEDDEEEDSLA